MNRPPRSLVILANLGTLRAFRVDGDEAGNPGHLTEITGLTQPPKIAPLGEQVSDQAGRFPGGVDQGIPGGMGRGDGHHRSEELERRQIRWLTDAISDLVREEDCDLWRLAAPAAINNRIVASLLEAIQMRLVLNLHADLTKLPLQEIEERLVRGLSSVQS